MSPPGRDAAPAGTGADDNTAHRTCSATADRDGSRDRPPSARAADPGTSWAATRDRWGARPTQRARYLVAIARAGARGRIAAELQAEHGGEVSPICRRCTDLTRDGLIRPAGARKSRRTGYQQTVHVATAAGVRAAAELVAAWAATDTEGAA